MSAKLRLNVDELQVQGFETAEDAGGHGTVQAHGRNDEGVRYGTYDEDTCFGASCRRGTACNICPSYPYNYC
ncbi:MAG TPA: hypothetical protein VFJ82_02215 [Longimicrobium sp.]|nr:hypothetical protein [Longimicrobium sp.]